MKGGEKVGAKEEGSAVPPRGQWAVHDGEVREEAPEDDRKGVEVVLSVA